MATANDLIRDALLDTGIIGQDDEIDGTVAADAFRRLNQMLSSFGGSEGFITYQFSDPSQDLALQDGYELMIWTNLAVMIGPSYGKEASPTVQRIASATKRTLKRATSIPPRLKIDGLVYQGRTNSNSAYDVFNNTFDGPQWDTSFPGLEVPPVFPPVVPPAPSMSAIGLDGASLSLDGLSLSFG